MEFWGLIFLMIVLKIPLAALCWLVWWAIKQTPEEADAHDGDDGGSHIGHPREPLPRHPRRGPHGDPTPTAPPRVRTTAARARTPER